MKTAGNYCMEPYGSILGIAWMDYEFLSGNSSKESKIVNKNSIQEIYAESLPLHLINFEKAKFFIEEAHSRGL